MAKRFTILDLYKHLQYQLRQWVQYNPKIGKGLDNHTCEKLLIVSQEYGVLIDLFYCDRVYTGRYFNDNVFYENAAILIKQVCLLIKKNAEKLGYPQFTIYVSIQHNGKELRRLMHIHKGFE